MLSAFWYSKHQQYSGKMEKQLFLLKTFTSFSSFAELLNEYSKRNSVTFVRIRCQRIDTDPRAQYVYNSELKVISCIYRCMSSYCPVYIKLKAIDAYHLQIVEINLKHIHLHRPNLVTIQLVSAELEAFLSELPPYLIIPTIDKMKSILDEWREEEKLVVIKKKDIDFFASENACMVRKMIKEFEHFTTQLRTECQIPRMMEFRYMMSEWNKQYLDNLAREQKQLR